jgi:hypothetical protein
MPLREYRASTATNLPTTKRMDDLDPVAIGQRMVRMAAARDDLAVHLDRHTALGQALGIEQGGDGGPGVQMAGLAVQEHVDRIGHAGIFA